MKRTYTDFKLELRDFNGAAGIYKVAILDPDAPPAETVEWKNEELEDSFDDLDRKRLSIEDAIELGRLLANRLLPAGPVREVWHRAVRAAGIDGGVRLRLVIRALELAKAPWEYVNLSPAASPAHSAGDFLALNPQISIARHEPVPLPTPQLGGRDPLKLQLLAASANVAGMRPLKLAAEKKLIDEALGKFHVDGVSMTWQFREDCTLEDLETALHEGADIFHFAGHGLFEVTEVDPQSGEPKGSGKIVLLGDKQTGARRLLDAADLAALLQGAGARFAVLGACRSGGRDNASAWSGVAPALLKSGIAAAVAMQFEVEDDAAVAFSSRFYTALGAGLSLDEATAAGRRAMWDVNPGKTLEWGVPVLYMRSADGVVFPELAKRESETAATIRLHAKAEFQSIQDQAHVINQEIDARRAKSDLLAQAEAKVGEVKNANFTNQKVTL